MLKLITEITLFHQRDTMRWRIRGPVGDAPGVRSSFKKENSSQLALLHCQG